MYDLLNKRLILGKSPPPTYPSLAECETPEDLKSMLMENEEVLCAYKTVRDAAVFTNLRLIVRDAQGLTGKKN